MTDMGTPSEGGESAEAASTDPEAGAASTRPRPAAAVPFDLGDILRRAWATFAAAWPECLMIHWGAAALSWLILFLLTATLASINVLAGDRELLPYLEFIHFLGLFVIPAWIYGLGRSLGLLTLARREPLAHDTLFQCGPHLLTFLLAAAIVASPCLIIYGTAEALLALEGHGSLVSLIRIVLAGQARVLPAGYESRALALLAVMGSSYAALFAVMVRLGQFPYLIIDRGADVQESFLGSLELTRGRVATVFLVYLAQVTINVAGLLLCCVGLFVTLPLNGLISAVTYDVLSRDWPGANGKKTDTEDIDLAA
jgi:hypothetical protein